MRLSKSALFAVVFFSVLSPLHGQHTGASTSPSRVLVTRSDAWERTSKADTDPFVTILGQRCRELVVTLDPAKEADYVIRLDLEYHHGKAVVPKLFNSAGETLSERSAPDITEAARVVCGAIRNAKHRKYAPAATYEPDAPSAPPSTVTDHWPGAAKNKKK